VDFLFAYTGRERDEETGLYYYRARYYDPAVGRFVSEDPLGFAAGDTNLFRYVRNVPVLRIDPHGKTEDDPYYRWWNPFTWYRNFIPRIISGAILIEWREKDRADDLARLQKELAVRLIADGYTEAVPSYVDSYYLPPPHKQAAGDLSEANYRLYQQVPKVTGQPVR
jgi:RHS repeat-associated protein